MKFTFLSVSLFCAFAFGAQAEEAVFTSNDAQPELIQVRGGGGGGGGGHMGGGGGIGRGGGGMGRGGGGIGRDGGIGRGGGGMRHGGGGIGRGGGAGRGGRPGGGRRGPPNPGGHAGGHRGGGDPGRGNPGRGNHNPPPTHSPPPTKPGGNPGHGKDPGHGGEPGHGGGNARHFPGHGYRVGNTHSRDLSRWVVAEGWIDSWIWDEVYVPDWVTGAEGPVEWPRFEFLNGVPVGDWQCTAYNYNDEELTPYSDIGKTQNQAAYDALYLCGGKDWKAAGCFIPKDHCELRK